MPKKSRLEELTDLIMASDKHSIPPQKAETTDPFRELKSPQGLGGMHLSMMRIQREILRLQSLPSDELNEVEAQRLDAYYDVLNKTDFRSIYARSDSIKCDRFNTLYINPIFHEIIHTGDWPFRSAGRSP